MKKKMLLLALAGFFLGGILSAQEKICGIDVVAGANFGFDLGKVKLSGIEYKDTWQDTSFELKINTYDFFALDNHLGVYASFGYMIGTKHSEKIKANGNEVKDDDSYFNQEIELFFGPAFGFDVGRNRFQTGVAFHTIGGITKTDKNGQTAKGYYYWVGFALTPQFRFNTSKQFSLVTGCDLTFDFAHKTIKQFENSGSDNTYNVYVPDSSFRFGMTPYVGLGINF